MEKKLYVSKNSSRYVKDSRDEHPRSHHDKKPKILSSNDRPKKTIPRSSGIEPHIHAVNKYNDFDWDSLDLNELYYEFKDLEKHLKALQEVQSSIYYEC